VRSLLSRHAETLSLADGAAALPFEGFKPGTRYNYLFGELAGVSRLCELRAKLEVYAGRSDAAIDSLFTQAQVKRTGSTFLPISDNALQFVVERSHPSADVLQKLADALEGLDRDDQLKQDFIRLRSDAIDASHIPVSGGLFVIRDIDRPTPWELRRFNGVLDQFAQLIEAAGRPLRDRVRAVVAVGRWPDVYPETAERSRQNLEGFVYGRTHGLAKIRASRVLVAIEQYRRTHDERLPAALDDLVPSYIARLPLDPYTGDPMRYRLRERGYTVYSLGPNGRDDGGELTRDEKRDLGRREPEYWKTRDDPGIRIQ
jgi:hypothetical protein